MARKETADAPSARGFGDIIGIVLLVLAVLLMASLLSYDPRDVSANTAVPNSPAHNWIGPIGAWLGYIAIFVFGAGAYVLPVLLIAFGLAFLFQFLGYLLHRWVWACVLFLCCLGLLHLYNDSFPSVAKGLNAPSAGGRVGMFEHEFFIHFGRAGATIIYLALYFISLLFLTNFQLGEWLRMLWTRREEAVAAGVSTEEKALERRKKELEKEERRLREQVEKSPKIAKPDKVVKAVEKPSEDDASGAGLGADLQPVPEPMVRDLSVSQSKQQRAAGRKAAEREQKAGPDEIVPVLEGEVISAREIVAATSVEILGKPLAPVGSAKPAATKTLKDKPEGEAPFDVDGVSDNTAESAAALAATTAPMSDP
ncbi:MAG: DNA translocase FtsK 4TM domain-containing protein, partial [Opitutaceae bacterium]|nr:DNA translocase FtsK 4TM domain-containing protein [Verrucomicrobiales bacterium]